MEGRDSVEAKECDGSNDGVAPDGGAEAFRGVFFFGSRGGGGGGGGAGAGDAGRVEGSDGGGRCAEGCSAAQSHADAGCGDHRCCQMSKEVRARDGGQRTVEKIQGVDIKKRYCNCNCKLQPASCSSTCRFRR